MRTENLGACLKCGTPLLGKRPDAKYCSSHCANRSKRKTIVRECSCPVCHKTFMRRPTHEESNKKYCSRQCSRRASEKKIGQWKVYHPGYMKEYNRNRLVKNPGAWTEKYRRERKEAITLLGGKCAACGTDNPYWLHIDYIPTTRGKPSRHSRHIEFIRAHQNDFRLLCANHHYELTLTGKIEGTNIQQ